MVAYSAMDWAILATSFGLIVLGLVIGVQAYRGFRRNDSRSMQYLSIGLILLTAVPFTLSFLGTLVMSIRPDLVAYRRHLTLVAQFLQFGGLALITYSLYEKP
jgi:uncharacterized membrane protein